MIESAGFRRSAARATASASPGAATAGDRSHGEPQLPQSTAGLPVRWRGPRGIPDRRQDGRVPHGLRPVHLCPRPGAHASGVGPLGRGALRGSNSRPDDRGAGGRGGHGSPPATLPASGGGSDPGPGGPAAQRQVLGSRRFCLRAMSWSWAAVNRAARSPSSWRWPDDGSTCRRDGVRGIPIAYMGGTSCGGGTRWVSSTSTWRPCRIQARRA